MCLELPNIWAFQNRGIPLAESVPQQIMGTVPPEQVTNQGGARFNPVYVQRNPPMWAVADTDMMGLSILANTATLFFGIGSFTLGFAANIFVAYSGVEKLTDVAAFMLHTVTWISIIVSLACYLVGSVMTVKKGSL